MDARPEAEEAGEEVVCPPPGGPGSPNLGEAIAADECSLTAAEINMFATDDAAKAG